MSISDLQAKAVPPLQRRRRSSEAEAMALNVPDRHVMTQILITVE